MVPGDDELLTKLRRGTLEFCVLGILAGQRTYGLDIARSLQRQASLLGSEGTLYPLLARLRRSGWVVTTWQESVEGPPRRYYELTDEGHDALAAFTRVWGPFAKLVAELTDGGSR